MELRIDHYSLPCCLSTHYRTQYPLAQIEHDRAGEIRPWIFTTDTGGTQRQLEIVSEIRASRGRAFKGRTCRRGTVQQERSPRLPKPGKVCSWRRRCSRNCLSASRTFSVFSETPRVILSDQVISQPVHIDASYLTPGALWLTPHRTTHSKFGRRRSENDVDVPTAKTSSELLCVVQPRTTVCMD